MRGLFVGQAIVTDPLLEGGSGYALTAVSDSVTAEDRAHLLETPQVSDAMHQEKNPGRFLSFHRLPSGAWALSHRFVHGTRRQAYNRVVVHTLVVSRELLEAMENDAWLLIAKCRFRDPSGAWCLFTELAESVREADVREVFDLEARPPADPRSERYQMLGARCERLKQHWGGEEALRGLLARVLGAVEAGCGVLLPQEAVMEHLLAAAWSTLPRKDRLGVPWTTHLAAGGGAIFRLALTPVPSEARYQQREPERWVLLGEPAKSLGGGGEALAEAVVSRFDLFPRIDRGLPSLSRPGELREWVLWVLAGGGASHAPAAPRRLGLLWYLKKGRHYRPWKKFVREDPERVAGWLSRLMQGDGLSPDQLDVRWEEYLVQWRDTVERGKDLGDADTEACVRLLSQYFYARFYARWIQEASTGKIPRGSLPRITGQPGAVPRDGFEALALHLFIEARPAKSLDPDHPRAQVAVVTRWLKIRALEMRA